MVLGDFNIHVCCPDKPLVSQFLQIVDSFNLSQPVLGATHDKGHTLDLILSFGSLLQILQIEDSYFSDHKPIIFKTVLSRLVKQPLAGYYTHSLNSFTPIRFADAFVSSQFAVSFESFSSDMDLEEFASSFNNTCANIWDSFAPLKLKYPKARSQPWLNGEARVL